MDSADAKVLYRVDATLLMRLLATTTGVSQLAVPIEEVPMRFDELLAAVSRERRYGAGAAPVSDVQRNLWLRHSIFRGLVDDPVVYLDDLTDDEPAYPNSPTRADSCWRSGRRVCCCRRGRNRHRHPFSRRQQQCQSGGAASVGQHRQSRHHRATPLTADALMAKFPSWAKAYRGDNGAAELVADALAVLRGFRLVRIGDGVVYPLPAAARYAVSGTRDVDQDSADQDNAEEAR